jgi:hypothetical protein
VQVAEGPSVRKLAFYDVFPADAFLSQGSRNRCLYSVSRLKLVFLGLDEKAVYRDVLFELTSVGDLPLQIPSPSMANASRLGQPRLVPIHYEREHRQPWATAAPAATTASPTTTSTVLYSLQVASAEVAACRPIMLALNRG